MFGQTKFMLVGAGVGLLVVAYLVKKTTDIVPQILPKIDPTNPDNVVNQAAESMYQSVTGSTGTIGGDIYDATRGGVLDIRSSQNPAASAVDEFGQWATGDKNWNLGGAIYDWTH